MNEPDLIAEAITEAFGERCTEFESGCFCCEVWREYDELRAKPDKNGWLPIETAPKDGTVILLWGEFEDGSEPFIGWYSEEDSQRLAADMPRGPFVWKQHEASSIARDCVRFWYPMPLPPVTP